MIFSSENIMIVLIFCDVFKISTFIIITVFTYFSNSCIGLPNTNCPSVGDTRRVAGNLFQTLGPETAKLRGPYVDVDVDVFGTSRSPYVAERRK